VEPVRSFHAATRVALGLAFAIGVAAIAAPPTAQAQRFGVTAGWAQSNLTTYYGGGGCSGFGDCMNISSSSPHYGRDAWWYGLVFIQPLRRGIDFQGEALLATKGFGEPSEPAQQLTYIEFPLLARFAPARHDSSYIRPFLTIGPGFGVLVGCALKGGSCATSSGGAFRMRPLEFSWQLGAGVEFRSAGGQSTLLEARFERSLLDIDYPNGNTLSHSLVLRVARMF
jgi:hypothetical protein